MRKEALDILIKKKSVIIECRMIEDGMLFGYCKWDGKKLISMDGDNYYLDWVVEKYEYEGKEMTIWI